ncbi:hypothetical protein Efla_004805 [Eimeria flavescens]
MAGERSRQRQLLPLLRCLRRLHATRGAICCSRGLYAYTRGGGRRAAAAAAAGETLRAEGPPPHETQRRQQQQHIERPQENRHTAARYFSATTAANSAATAAATAAAAAAATAAVMSRVGCKALAMGVLLLLLLQLLLLGAPVASKTLGRGVWVSSGQFGIGEAKGPQSVSVGAALPLQLPFGISAFARLSSEVPLNVSQQQQQQQAAEKANQQQQQQQQQQNDDAVKPATLEASKLGALLQQRLQQQLRGQLQHMQQQLQQLQQSGLASEVVVGLTAPDSLRAAAPAAAAAAAVGVRVSGTASRGGSEVAATLRGLRVLSVAAQKGLQINKTLVALEGACDFEKGEAGFRVAAAGYTPGAAPLKQRRPLTPSLLGAQLRVKGPVNNLLLRLKPHAAAAAAATAALAAGEDAAAAAAAGEAGGSEEAAASAAADGGKGDSDAEVSLGLSVAFGSKAETLVEPQVHLPTRRLSLEVSRQLGPGSVVSFGLSPSGCLRMQWADAAADGGLWLLTAELPLPRLSRRQAALVGLSVLLSPLYQLLCLSPSSVLRRWGLCPPLEQERGGPSMSPVCRGLTVSFQVLLLLAAAPPFCCSQTWHSSLSLLLRASAPVSVCCSVSRTRLLSLFSCVCLLVAAFDPSVSFLRLSSPPPHFNCLSLSFSVASLRPPSSLPLRGLLYSIRPHAHYSFLAAAAPAIAPAAAAQRQQQQQQQQQRACSSRVCLPTSVCIQCPLCCKESLPPQHQQPSVLLLAAAVSAAASPPPSRHQQREVAAAEQVVAVSSQQQQQHKQRQQLLLHRAPSKQQHSTAAADASAATAACAAAAAAAACSIEVETQRGAYKLEEKQELLLLMLLLRALLLADSDSSSTRSRSSALAQQQQHQQQEEEDEATEVSRAAFAAKSEFLCVEEGPDAQGERLPSEIQNTRQRRLPPVCLLRLLLLLLLWLLLLLLLQHLALPYNKLCGLITKLVAGLRKLPPDDPFRLKMTQLLLDKLYRMGLVSRREGLAAAEGLPASAFCRRRLPVVLVQLKMADNITQAAQRVEQGHVCVGSEVVTSVSFHVTRDAEDMITWAKGSAVERQIQEFSNQADDLDLLQGA